jgi:hypothetical protein
MWICSRELTKNRDSSTTRTGRIYKTLIKKLRVFLKARLHARKIYIQSIHQWLTLTDFYSLIKTHNLRLENT